MRNPHESKMGHIIRQRGVKTEMPKPQPIVPAEPQSESHPETAVRPPLTGEAHTRLAANVLRHIIDRPNKRRQ